MCDRRFSPTKAICCLPWEKSCPVCLFSIGFGACANWNHFRMLLLETKQHNICVLPTAMECMTLFLFEMRAACSHQRFSSHGYRQARFSQSFHQQSFKIRKEKRQTRKWTSMFTRQKASCASWKETHQMYKMNLGILWCVCAKVSVMGSVGLCVHFSFSDGTQWRKSKVKQNKKAGLAWNLTTQLAQTLERICSMLLVKEKDSHPRGIGIALRSLGLRLKPLKN